jgi:hypothetical protein
MQASASSGALASAPTLKKPRNNVETATEQPQSGWQVRVTTLLSIFDHISFISGPIVSKPSANERELS